MRSASASAWLAGAGTVFGMVSIAASSDDRGVFVQVGGAKFRPRSTGGLVPPTTRFSPGELVDVDAGPSNVRRGVVVVDGVETWRRDEPCMSLDVS